jgi:DNA-binding SARP family transcriptional activator
VPLRIRLFGELDVRMDDQPGVPLESARARSLLASLVLHAGVAQPRSRLAFLLWPDSTESQARTNLRHLLHTLRTTVPAVAPYLEVTPQTIRWQGDGECWTDVAAFEAALARAAEAEPAGEEELAALREADGYYTGDLVEGCYDDWLIPERDRYRDRYTWAVRRLAGLLAARREHAEAGRLGRELLRIDPLREDTYRLLMRVHDAAGDRAAAVRTYHECVSALRRELGVEPSPPTREAYAALMREDRDPPPVSGAALVGRETEWRRLAGCWEGAEGSGARLVLVSGEPGIGKTRLVEDFAAWCGHRGATVVAGRSYPEEGELGYGVVQAWLRAPALAAHLRRLPDHDRAQLARLLPELGPAGRDTGDAAEQRRRLFESVARALAAPGRPVLLVADDAQWCDGPSLQVLHYLVRLEPSPPLLVVATVRREDLDDAHAVTGVLAGLQGIERVTEITLDRLDRGETAELARRLAGRPLDGEEAGVLHAETEGNPLFIVETLRAGWDRSAISPRLQSVITARLRQLSEPAQALLGLAATVGREFTTGVLAAASALDELTLVRALDELWRRGLVREQGTDAYDFSHGRIRDVVYDSLAPAARRHHHLVIAGALAGAPGARAGDVARHYQRAGRPRDAVAWYRRAAVEAQRLHAYMEAVRLLDRALELATGGDDEQAVLAALPTPLAVVEGFASSRLAEVQRRLLDSGVDPQPELLRSLVMSSLCRRDFDAARRRAGHLRASAAGDEVLLVESEYLLGISAFWAGDFVAARAHFEAVDRRADPARRAEHVLRFGQDPRPVCVSRLANTLLFLGDDDAAFPTADRALTMAEELRHPFTTGVVCIFAALLAVDMEDPERFGRYLEQLPDATGQQALEVAARALRGFGDVLAGDPDAGIRRIRDAVELSSVDHAPCQQATHLHLLVRAYEVAGDAAGGLEAAEEALAAPGTRIWDADHRRARTRFLAALAGERSAERLWNARAPMMPATGFEQEEQR